MMAGPARAPRATRPRPWLDHYDYWVPHHTNYPRRSLYEILRRTAAESHELTATTFLGAELTFGELKQHADRLATSLARLGIVKGDRIGIMLPNCPQYPIAVFAILRLGAIIVNVNPAYTPPEVEFITRDSGIRVLVTLDRLVTAVTPLLTTTGLRTIVITALAEYSPAGDAPAAVDGTLRLCDLIAESPAIDLPRVPIDADEDVAVLQYTGGTTGAPKAAMLTHRNIFANTIQTELWHHRSVERGRDRFLMVIPYFHIYGLTVGLMRGVWQGAQQILIPRYDVETVLAALRDYRPTYFPAVPTIYVSLLNHPRLSEFQLDRVCTYNSGSAPIAMEVLERFERATNVPLNQGYGLSEASPVTHSTPHLAKRKPASIGLPMPDTDVKIVDLETGTRELPLGEEGELCVSGPQVMKGYWNRPDETAIALRTDTDGVVWLHTGDVARIDEDGFTYIVQRKKDMIIVDGYNVYPSEVEAAIHSHPAVMEVAAVAAPHAYHGEVVRAVVVLKPGQAATPDELKAHCITRLAEYKRPRTIEIRDSLPKSAVGKVLYTKLRAEAAAPNV
ncbi:MAG TPA: long-chain fatty acid--CoA ligase [Vicinamibacterales bacterium]|nr:long-chain fatty acid--CoA ligase [Vicinamibacterales bacterium]